MKISIIGEGQTMDVLASGCGMGEIYSPGDVYFDGKGVGDLKWFCLSIIKTICWLQ